MSTPDKYVVHLGVVLLMLIYRSRRKSIDLSELVEVGRRPYVSNFVQVCPIYENVFLVLTDTVRRNQNFVQVTKSIYSAVDHVKDPTLFQQFPNLGCTRFVLKTGQLSETGNQ